MKITISHLLCGIITLCPGALGDSTETFETCTTLQGPSSTSPIPTRTFSTTQASKATVKVTSTPTKTVTPKASTITATSTRIVTQTTTIRKSTNTVTDTVTSTSTTTETEAVTSTETTTSTSTSLTSGTTTVPTSAGFTPAAVELGNAAPARMGRRGLIERAEPQANSVSIGSDGKPTTSPNAYPTQVYCADRTLIVKTTTSTITAKNTATVTAAPPPASTTTKTVTSTTTTTVPGASTTTTTTSVATATTTTVTTITTTTTSTVVVESPSATYYAACASDNIQTRVNRNYFIYAYGTNNTRSTIDRFQGAYECCVSCITSPTCGASVYVPTRFSCTLIDESNGVCDPKNVVGIFSGSIRATANQFYVSTGNCGAVAVGQVLN